MNILINRNFPLIWFFACLSLSLFYPAFNNDLEQLWFTVASTISYVLCIYHWVKCGNRITSLFCFFIVYCFFSNAGQSLLYALRFPDEFLPVYHLHSMADICRMLRYQAIAAAALFLGSASLLNSKHNKGSQNLVSCYSSSEWNSTIPSPFLRFLFVLTSIFMLYTAVNMLTMRHVMDYSEFYAEGRGSLWGWFGNLISYLNMGLSIYYIMNKHHVKLIYLYLLFLVAVFMITGARSGAIPYVGIIMVMFPLSNPSLFKRKYIPVWIAVVLSFMILMNLIQMNRTYTLSASDILKPEELIQGVTGAVSEMGLSERPPIITISAVESGSTPHYQTILAGLIQAFIPFSSHFTFVEENTLALTTWVTDYIGEDRFGLGYSFIAETYMNYGRFGVIFCLIYGYLIAFLEIKAYQGFSEHKFLLPIIILIFLCIQVFWARGKFASCINYLRWCEILGIFYLFIKK